MPGGSEHKQAKTEEEIAWLSAAFIAARRFGLRIEQVIDCRGKSTRAPPAVLPARRMALYLASTAANLNGHALARASGMRRPTIRYHLACVEDSRELKADIDAQADEMTAALRRGLALAAVGMSVAA